MKRTPAQQIHVIYPNAVYFVDQAMAILRLRDSTIRREVRAGRLRIAKRAGRYFLLGVWILEWLKEGEIQRKKERNSGSPWNN